MEAKKFLLPLFFVLNAVVFFVLTKLDIFKGLLCGGFAANVFCVAGWLMDFFVGIAGWILAGVNLLYALIFLFVTDSVGRRYVLLGSLFASLAVVTFFVPDPVPFVDEILFPVLSGLFTLIGLFKSEDVKVGGVF